MTLERFLFSPANPLHAGICRLMFAGVLVLVFWPRGAVPDATVASTVHWVATAVVWVMFCAGIAPRAAGLLLAILLFPLSSEAGVHVSRQVLLFALLAFSMTRSGERLGLGRRAAGSPSAGPVWPIRLMQLQLSVVYGMNALAKSTPQFLSGDALMALSLLPNFRVNLSDGYLHLHLLDHMLDVPAWLAALVVVLTEYTPAVGVWIPRLRLAVALLGAAFHVGLTWVVQIGMLHVACLFLYVSFLLPFVEDQRPEHRPATESWFHNL
jgi:hypothetical protein